MCIAHFSRCSRQHHRLHPLRRDFQRIHIYTSCRIVPCRWRIYFIPVWKSCGYVLFPYNPFNVAGLDANLGRRGVHLFPPGIQFCRCLYFGISNLYAVVPKKILRWGDKIGCWKPCLQIRNPRQFWRGFFVFLFLQFVNQFLSGKMYTAFYCSKVKAKLICYLLILVAVVVHLERNAEFRL